ncbi:uncharacterized protein [Coffea arabica]|uniref:DDE Tnp4 domain-containing protein n=1 Tax=Coffea arabica TaxID=13443 RepID=A0ABM4W1G9_COFAR
MDHYRNRHDGLSHNILTMCDHNMRFTYVSVGWEGSVHDSRILRDILLDPNCAFPMPPAGKYYAVKALFNRRHASLRNIIKRAFDVLKKQFSILKRLMQNYLMATQNNIILVYYVLHNFIRDHVPNDAYFVEKETVAVLTDNLD